MEFARTGSLDADRINDGEDYFAFPVSQDVDVCARTLDSGASYVYYYNHRENRVQSRASQPVSPGQGMNVAGGHGDKAVRRAGLKKRSFKDAKWAAQRRACKMYDAYPYGASYSSYSTSDFVKLRALAGEGGGRMTRHEATQKMQTLEEEINMAKRELDRAKSDRQRAKAQAEIDSLRARWKKLHDVASGAE